MRFLVAAALVGLTPVAAAAADPATVTVFVENVETDVGVVKVALCNKSLSEDGCQVFAEVPAVPGIVTAVFENVVAGQWAIAAFHDRNKSGAMDTTFGIPKEPYALSNNATERMIPTLKDAVVKIIPGPNEIHVKLGMFMSR